jgi:hypothetical protein
LIAASETPEMVGIHLLETIYTFLVSGVIVDHFTRKSNAGEFSLELRAGQRTSQCASGIDNQSQEKKELKRSTDEHGRGRMLDEASARPVSSGLHFLHGRSRATEEHGIGDRKGTDRHCLKPVRVSSSPPCPLLSFSVFFRGPRNVMAE